MNTQFLYQVDPNKLEFETQVVEILALPESRKGVVLEQSYFYPTGGGQEHDTGQIGTARVVEVYKDDPGNRIIHVVDGDLLMGLVQARIDGERRLRHMQHHTAQHLLTQCLLHQTGYETVSANINGYSPSTLDLVATQVSKLDLEQAELQANQIIYENRLVKTYFVTPQELQSIPLRRLPKVTENIRIVEIDGYDYSPCGGTHVERTGSIGLVKVLKAERQNDRLRVNFMAGLQSLEIFSQMYDSVVGLANQMSISWQDLPDVVGKQAELINSLQKDLQMHKQASLRYEARDLAEQAEVLTGVRVIRKVYENRPVSELRLMAEALKQMADLVCFLACYDGQKISLVVTCGESTGKDARRLLNAQLFHINGRGGGDIKLAQGGGTATIEQFRNFLDQIVSL